MSMESFSGGGGEEVPLLAPMGGSSAGVAGERACGLGARGTSTVGGGKGVDAGGGGVGGEEGAVTGAGGRGEGEWGGEEGCSKGGLGVLLVNEEWNSGGIVCKEKNKKINGIFD